MTLLGKLFRPWDLPAEEELSSKSEDSTPGLKRDISLVESDITNFSPDMLCNIKRCFNFGDSKRESQSDINKRISSPPKVSNNNEEEEYSTRRNSSNSKSDNVASSNTNTTTTESSDCDKNEQCSMMDFDLNSVYNSSQSASHLFLHPNAINDLANLSRNELTAMGLIPPDQPTAMKVKRQRPKRFHCPHCQVAFSNNGQLRGHIRIHTGERPFSCDQEGCGKSFTRNEELTRHRRIHSGLRPFPCTYCGKKFGRKDHLKKHTRTHQRPMYNPAAGMIGFGNPFHPFNPPLMSSHSMMNEFNSTQPSYALPFVLSVPPPISHFPFS